MKTFKDYKVFIVEYENICICRLYLKECGIKDSQIIAVNFEDVASEPLLDYRNLHEYVTERLNPDKMTYVFLDEIQNVPEFQKAVDSFLFKDNFTQGCRRKKTDQRHPPA